MCWPLDGSSGFNRDLPRVIVYEERLAAKKFCAYVPDYLRPACHKLRYPP